MKAEKSAKKMPSDSLLEQCFLLVQKKREHGLIAIPVRPQTSRIQIMIQIPPYKLHEEMLNVPQKVPLLQLIVAE